VPFRFPDGSFEHFGFFRNVFRHTGDSLVFIFDVVPDIGPMLDRHPHPEDFVSAWKAARAEFYGAKDGTWVSPAQMCVVYSEKVRETGYIPKLVTYSARNGFFGFITIAASR
jgi:hypothetical protein